MEPSNELLFPLPDPNSSTRLGLVGAHRGALIRDWTKAIGLGLLAAGITLCFFCPRLFAWEALDVPGLEYLPEVNRANFVMQQLSNPWLVVTNVGNVVIMWRLLFPIIWYILGLPSTAFLAVPMIGCWAVLAFATHRIKIVTGRWLWAFVGAIVLSGCSWFFISMGWLTYADSWIVLAFVAIAYARSPWCLLVVGILAPWIDERFVIGLPLAILVRILHPVNEPGLATRNPMESMACFPGVIFYVGIRLWALVMRDHTSASFLTVNLDPAHAIGVPATRYALGLWQGILPVGSSWDGA